ncbi:MAG: copper amine oxidase N-terminal domain-containing protein [Defluviitaleaceae bacterium]|nr:copper amine oxidase N-terminal domain-containing protein [Defluviitaleaceae bacterium]MCL2239396.1 copper amine oxidase N-terminal domain-containing protein [Defluviitaleaceae bacterium]
MKKAKKVAAILLAAVAVLVMVTGVSAFGADAGGVINANGPNYGSVTGEVLSVEESGFGYRIRVAAGESHADFNVTHATFIKGDFPQVGDTLTGFFDMNRPMITIYPPQYPAVVLVNTDGDLPFVFVDRFHTAEGTDELISADGSRRLNVSHPDTVIRSQDGQDATDWALDGRLLVVVYDVSSRSMPPFIFAPKEIIVMYETAIHPGPAEIDWEMDWESDDGYPSPPVGEISDLEDIEYDNGNEVLFHDIVVNGVGLPGETFHAEGTQFPTHVPIRAVAQAIDPDMTVGWSSGQVTLEGAWGHISFRAGEAEIIANGETITLNQPTVNVNGRVQVPLSFFRYVAGMNNAYSIGGTVFIDNFERTE